MAVNELISAALAEVDRDPEGILSLATRKRLWTELAELSGDRDALSRRVQLDAMCVRHVLDHWTTRFDPKEIEDMLALANELVAGTIDEATADDRRGRFYTDVVDNRRYGPDPSAMFVGHAAANTVVEAMIPNSLDAMPSVDDDEELDPESYHPSYMAASAAAGGLNGRPSDAVARRRFWQWYVQDAIRSVYPI